MPKIIKKRKKVPEGFNLIKEVLEEFDVKIRDAEQEPYFGKRKVESTWKITQLLYKRSRYIFN